MMFRKHTLALAIGLCTAQAWAATPAAPDVVKDPKGAWAHFLAHGDSADVVKALSVRNAIGYSMTDADPAKCKDNAAALDEALASVPVSIAFHRMAMLCAEATGDAKRAERELEAVAALSKLALASASESENAAPVRVVMALDMDALLASTGLERRYGYYNQFTAEYDFPYVAAVWDPERKLERHLRFDWTDTWVQISREPVKYPMLRTNFANAFIDNDAKANNEEAIDILTLRRVLQSPIAERPALLRTGVDAGGILSAATWAAICEQKGMPKQCADGYVEAVLPMAEKQYALPMALLAYGYAQGLGVRKDEAAAMKLLDAADARWVRNGASAAYIDLWMISHDEPLPPALAQRLARALQAGNENALFLQMKDAQRRDPKFKPDAKQVAYLRSDAQNGKGEGYAWLATTMDENAAETKAIEQLAAEHGDADSQSTMAARKFGFTGEARDEAAGREWLERAAHGGNTWAASFRSSIARSEGDGAGAQGWLFAPATEGDIDAQLALADVWSSDLPNMSGDREKAMGIRRELAQYSPAARRNLARALIFDDKTPKDPVEARKLLTADAEGGDHESEAMLGMAILHGDLGPVDEAAGTKWMERALAGGNASAPSDYAFWLFYRKGTDASRAQGLKLWREHLKAPSSANNLAWALCTSDIASARDAKAGMEAVKEMGNVESLEFGEQDTVAACQAASGDFASALALQKQVNAKWRAQIKNAKSTPEQEKQTKEFDKRLALYEAKQPYIEGPEDRE